MAVINLHESYSKKLAERFVVDSFLKGNTSNDYSFDGVKSINISTIKAIPVTTYTRNGLQRFGQITEVEDTVQTLTMTQEPSWTASIDIGNASDQQYEKKAGKVMKSQSDEVTTPMSDKYALQQFAQNAGQIVELANAPAKTTIVEMLFNAATALDNAYVPTAGRVLYIKSSDYNKVRLSPEFIGVDNLAEKILTKGTVGQIADMKVVKLPDNYMPKNVHFMITHKKSVIMPFKLKTARIHDTVVGVDGRVLEWHSYYDAFVIGAKANGVYVAAEAGTVTAVPTVEIADTTATITGTGTVYYTTDGSDPRYSRSAKVYSAPVEIEAGATVSAYAVETDKFKSAVVSEVSK
ncbi:MAG: chitobiase/beta-hexosaminidase C-terminal domain-containing protein [Peptococcaceae bacterium]|nr:chitobiase/beta-hexosaminidase C-terminal domain-containing protein [Peptococcaceae bacterium]